MSIQKFRHDELLGLELKSWGEGKKVDDLPPSAISGKGIRTFGDRVKHCGVWEASPGLFVREVEAAEFMYFVKGECSFTTIQGETIEISSGDCVFFPANTQGTWDIREATRKVYLMI